MTDATRKDLEQDVAIAALKVRIDRLELDPAGERFKMLDTRISQLAAEVTANNGSSVTADARLEAKTVALYPEISAMRMELKTLKAEVVQLMPLKSLAEDVAKLNKFFANFHDRPGK